MQARRCTLKRIPEAETHFPGASIFPFSTFGIGGHRFLVSLSLYTLPVKRCLQVAFGVPSLSFVSPSARYLPHFLPFDITAHTPDLRTASLLERADFLGGADARSPQRPTLQIFPTRRPRPSPRMNKSNPISIALTNTSTGTCQFFGEYWAAGDDRKSREDPLNEKLISWFYEGSLKLLAGETSAKELIPERNPSSGFRRQVIMPLCLHSVLLFIPIISFSYFRYLPLGSYFSAILSTPFPLLSVCSATMARVPRSEFNGRIARYHRCHLSCDRDGSRRSQAQLAAPT